MTRLMEEAAPRHAETVHYSASADIRVGGGEARKANEAGFWPTMLEGLAGARLRKDEVDRAEKRVWEITGWSDPVKEKTGRSRLPELRGSGRRQTGRENRRGWTLTTIRNPIRAKTERGRWDRFPR